jgi:hypothetical protein
VGKGSKSPITPLAMNIPAEITLDLLKSLYVSSGGLAVMAEYLHDAEPWLNAWKNRESSKQEDSMDPNAALAMGDPESEEIPF